MRSDLTAPAPVVWRQSRSALAWLGISAVACAVIFWPALAELWRSWMNRSEYSFGVFIPLISAFLIWQRKDRIELTGGTGTYKGVLLIIAGLCLWILGELAVAMVFLDYALLLCLFGLSLCFLGVSGTRLISVPLAMLVFMMPLPEFLMQTLSLRLQIISSELGVAFIRLFGISVFLDGNIIDLGALKLQVAEACSGLRYLFSLLTLGFIAAYFFKGNVWKRSALFVSAVPITIFMNSIRIALVGITVDYYGLAAAEGLLHEFEGLIIFLGCTIILILEMWFLARVGAERMSLQAAFGLEFPAPTPKGAQVYRRSSSGALSLSASLLVAASTAAAVGLRPVSHVPERVPFSRFPMTIAGFLGTPHALDKDSLDILQLDDYLLVDYDAPRHSPINLYIQYFRKQDRNGATHSPRLCIPAGGWEIVGLETRAIPQAVFHGHALEVNRVMITKGTLSYLTYYWFQQRGRNTTNEYGTKLLILWDALSRSRTDGSMIRIMTPIKAGEKAGAADDRLSQFASELLPKLEPFIPD